MTLPPRPYADAPRLPGTTEPVDVRALVRGTSYELEIGPGRGGFLLERAAAAPDAGLVGLEVRRKWAAIVDARLRVRGFGDRARVFAEDATFAMRRLTPDGVFARVYFHFPDPWWKKRHQKRLVVKPGVIDEVSRLLARGGELFVQTDVEDRAVAYEELLSRDARLRLAGDSPASPRLAENPYGARSPRERRAMKDGLPIFRLRFERA